MVPRAGVHARIPGRHSAGVVDAVPVGKTVWEHLALGLAGVSDEEVEDACRGDVGRGCRIGLCGGTTTKIGPCGVVEGSGCASTGYVPVLLLLVGYSS